MPLGHVSVVWEKGDDGLLREKRTRTEAEAACPVCGEAVELDAETFEWVQVTQFDGSHAWEHSLYGPPAGQCVKCELAFCDTGERVEVFSLKGN